MIVGRWADYILREAADCLNLFIYSDITKWAKRIVEQYGMRDVSLENALPDKDKRSTAYYQLYIGKGWGVVQNYPIALNSGALGIDSCVRIIAELY